MAFAVGLENNKTAPKCRRVRVEGRQNVPQKSQTAKETKRENSVEIEVVVLFCSIVMNYIHFRKGCDIPPPIFVILIHIFQLDIAQVR